MADHSKKPTALFVSPHLDDVAFSCGATLALLARSGWHTVLATVFTRSVPDPTGFALACQTDKGLLPEVDYMALRREEDREAAEHLGAGERIWLDLPEAPHRGYESAAAMFAGVPEEDEVWSEVAENLRGLLEAHTPDVLFAPQALGEHADHLQVVRAVLELADAPAAWYRDAPYATRNPKSLPSPLLPDGLSEVAVDVTETLDAKLRASAAYGTQLGFQFDGEGGMRETLSGFAASEARRLGLPSGEAAEALMLPETGELLENDVLRKCLWLPSGRRL
ncbi:MAG: PIG-L family deacetylase [Actinobacteria bacterium]|nr:MAG: PIG-L family deacetylase [Actinomycetota bacterium]